MTPVRLFGATPLSREDASAWVCAEEALWWVTIGDADPPAPPTTPRLPEAAPRLSEVWLYANADCNLRCSHCLVPPRPLRPSLDSLLARAAEARELGATTVFVTGGEPFLRDDAEELLAELVRDGDVMVLTNGTLVTPERLDRLASLTPDGLRGRLGFQVSLDGTEAVHDARRGGNAFARAVAGIQALVAFGLPPAISTALTAANLDVAPEVTRLVAELGCRVHHLLLPHVTGRLEHGKVPPAPALLATMRRCRSAAQQKGVILSNDAAIASRIRRPGRRFDGCTGGCAMMAVAADGSLYPCPSLVGRAELADSAGTSLEGAIREGRASSMRDATLARRGSCAKCELRHFCGGGCAAHAYLAGGSYDSEEPYCAVYRGLIEDCLRAEAERLLANAEGDALADGALVPAMADAVLERYRFGCT